MNFRDYGPDRRGVSAASLDAVLSAPPFTSRTFRPQALDASMANCFGLHALHAFLAVPFLAHKRAELSRALDSNTAAMGAAHKALAEVRGATYEDFVARLEATARAEAAAADMARLQAAEAAAAAEKAEAERWSWLTGDNLAQPPGPGGAPGGPPRAAGVPIVQPGTCGLRAKKTNALLTPRFSRFHCRWWRFCGGAAGRAAAVAAAARRARGRVRGRGGLHAFIPRRAGEHAWLGIIVPQLARGRASAAQNSHRAA